jgi:hypothetical protein
MTDGSQLKLDLAAARSAIETIRVLDLNVVSIDEIKEILSPYFPRLQGERSAFQSRSLSL